MLPLSEKCDSDSSERNPEAAEFGGGGGYRDGNGYGDGNGYNSYVQHFGGHYDNGNGSSLQGDLTSYKATKP